MEEVTDLVKFKYLGKLFEYFEIFVIESTMRNVIF